MERTMDASVGKRMREANEEIDEILTYIAKRLAETKDLAKQQHMPISLGLNLIAVALEVSRKFDAENLTNEALYSGLNLVFREAGVTMSVVKMSPESEETR